MSVKALPVKPKTLKKVKKPQKQVTSWKPWCAQSGPQQMCVESDADDTLIGGPAGIGKTALALILASKHHRRSIIFRRQYPQLKEIIQKSRELLRGSGARYNGTDKVWRDIPGDRTIEFGACQYEDGKYTYQGREFSLYVFDEICHFLESQFRYIKNWNRCSLRGERCRVVCTGNPPTSKQGLWVIKYWAPWIDENYTKRTGRPKALPGELRWFISDKDGNDLEVDGPEAVEIENEDGTKEWVTPRSRTFITGTLDDNAFLAKTGYKATLQALPEPLRSQLLKGLWLNFDKDDANQVIPSKWVKAAVERWKAKPPTRRTHLGVDIARGGDDFTVIAPRHGFWMGELISLPGRQTPDGDAAADEIMNEYVEGTEIRIDVVGVGCSPYDAIRRRNKQILDKRRRINIVPISSGTKATEGKRDRSGLLTFANKRAEMWWNLRELLDPVNGEPIQLPDDEKLIEELTSLRWNVLPPREDGTSGVIQVESKDELAKKDRLGRSPDNADAVVYAFADEGNTQLEAMRALMKS